MSEAFEKVREDGLQLSDDRALIDMDRVHGWLTGTYWARGVSRAAVAKRLAGSRVYGIYDGGRQVAIARAVTDDASYVWVCDVFVDASVRGRGIGKWLVGSLVEHLQGFGIRRFVLATRDAHGVYEQVGFRPLRVPETWMEIDDRPTRPPASGD
ncbi:MAG: GNAT family N-acetyltransferase [Mycobacteriales bacterium]